MIFNSNYNMYRIKIFAVILVSIGALLALSGCSNRLKEKLGLIERGPDEFTVITHSDLEIPQDLNTLPVPHAHSKRLHSEQRMSKYYTETNDVDAAILDFETKSYEESLIEDSNDASFMQELR